MRKYLVVWFQQYPWGLLWEGRKPVVNSFFFLPSLASFLPSIQCWLSARYLPGTGSRRFLLQRISFSSKKQEFYFLVGCENQNNLPPTSPHPHNPQHTHVQLGYWKLGNLLSLKMVCLYEHNFHNILLSTQYSGLWTFYDVFKWALIVRFLVNFQVLAIKDNVFMNTYKANSNSFKGNNYQRESKLHIYRRLA